MCNERQGQKGVGGGGQTDGQTDSPAEKMKALAEMMKCPSPSGKLMSAWEGQGGKG